MMMDARTKCRGNIVRAVAGTVLTLTLLITAGTSGFAFSAKPPPPDYVPGQLLVKFRDTVSAERIEEILSDEGAAILKPVGSTGVYLIQLPEGADVMESVDRFSSFPEVLFAEPNQRVQAQEDR